MAPINLNVLFCKNNHFCHKRYGWGGRDHRGKDFPLSIMVSNADLTESACQLIICLYWKGAFVRRKGKRTLGIFHCLLGIMAVGKEGFSFVKARFIIIENANTIKRDIKNSIRKGLEKYQHILIPSI